MLPSRRQITMAGNARTATILPTGRRWYLTIRVSATASPVTTIKPRLTTLRGNARTVTARAPGVERILAIAAVLLTASPAMNKTGLMTTNRGNARTAIIPVAGGMVVEEMAVGYSSAVSTLAIQHCAPSAIIHQLYIMGRSEYNPMMDKGNLTIESTRRQDKVELQVEPDSSRCVQCGMCSYYCPIGIDVRWHSWLDKPVIDRHCLTCGECIARCPRAVLRFEKTFRFPAPGEAMKKIKTNDLQKEGENV